MSGNRDSIPVVDKFTTTVAKIVQRTWGRKINSNQEPQDRCDKRPILIRERQVGLWTATSSRPLLLLNISAMGRGSGEVCLKGPPRERTTPASIIYYVTRSRGGARYSSIRGTGQILLPFPFPSLPRP